MEPEKVPDTFSHAYFELDIENPESIATLASKLIAEYPKLNLLINNAGVMNIDDASVDIDDKLLVSTLTTNVLGPIRMTSALIEHLKRQNDAIVVNVSSVLGFVPMAIGGGLFRNETRASNPTAVEPPCSTTSRFRRYSKFGLDNPRRVHTDEALCPSTSI